MEFEEAGEYGNHFWERIKTNMGWGWVYLRYGYNIRIEGQWWERRAGHREGRIHRLGLVIWLLPSEIIEFFSCQNQDPIIIEKQRYLGSK
jgi:hypothetical protein